MFKNQTYQTKFKLLLGGFILLLFIVFVFNIRKTIELKKTNTKLRSEYQATENTPIKIKQLEARLNELNNILGSSHECSELPEEIIDFTNHFVSNEKITLIELSEAETVQQENMSLCYFTITLSGNYNELLRYIYELETKNKIGRIASVNFNRVIQRNRKAALMLKVHLQNIEIK